MNWNWRKESTDEWFRGSTQLLGRIRGNGDTRAENTNGFPSESGAPPSGKYVLHHCQRGNLISESTFAPVDASLSLFTPGYPAPLCLSFLTPFISLMLYCVRVRVFTVRCTGCPYIRGYICITLEILFDSSKQTGKCRLRFI